MPNNNIRTSTLNLAKMALMTAVAVICTFIHFPLLPTATYMEFELASIPILIAGFVFGPIRGLVIAVASILIRALITGPPSGPQGLIMNLIATGVLVFVAASIYQKSMTKKSGLFALIIGGLAATAALIPANLIVTPFFLKIPIEAVVGMLLPIIIPFNLIKVAINTSVVFLIYKRLSPFLRKTIEAAPNDYVSEIKASKDKARRSMIGGIVWLTIGLFVTTVTIAITIAAASDIETAPDNIVFIVLWAAILFSFMWTVRSFTVYSKYSKIIQEAETRAAAVAPDIIQDALPYESSFQPQDQQGGDYQSGDYQGNTGDTQIEVLDNDTE